MFRADQMRNPVRYDARLSAAGTCENEHRAFGGCYSFTLLGIQTREKVHYQTILANGLPTTLKNGLQETRFIE